MEPEPRGVTPQCAIRTPLGEYMPSNLKFPPSVEIKRVIAAASKSGIEIGSIEIESRRIIIHASTRAETGATAYDLWKESERAAHGRGKVVDAKSGALEKKESNFRLLSSGNRAKM